MSTNVPKSTSDQTAKRCRYELFVRLKFSEMQRFPNKSATWCYRGDKFTIDEDKMLINLIRQFINHNHKYQLAELYDNSKLPPDRIILRFKEGVIETNRLQEYNHIINKIILPEYLKS